MFRLREKLKWWKPKKENDVNNRCELRVMWVPHSSTDASHVPQRSPGRNLLLGRPQNFCCCRLLASMASRMGFLLAWYRWRTSSISCSICGSREARRRWSSSTDHELTCRDHAFILVFSTSKLPPDQSAGWDGAADGHYFLVCGHHVTCSR